jgi:putative membrane protein
MRKFAVWLGATTAILTGSPAAAQDAAPGWQHGPGMMWDGGWAWMMLFGPLMMILFVAAVVVLVVVALRWLGGHVSPARGHAAAPGPLGRTPLDILKERFARGEIDKAEFEERRRVLEE